MFKSVCVKIPIMPQKVNLRVNSDADDMYGRIRVIHSMNIQYTLIFSFHTTGKDKHLI